MSENKRRPVHFENGVDCDWQYTTEFNDLVKTFHDKRACEPHDDMAEAKKLHTTITNELQTRLKEMGICSRLEYTGSAYEGVKVVKTFDNKDLEFDIMVIMKGGNELRIEPTVYPGYAFLKPISPESCSENIRKALDKDGYVSADKIASTFMGNLFKCLKSCQEDQANRMPGDRDEALRFINDRIILRRHGPAAQMDVYHTKRSAPVEERKDSEADESGDSAIGLIENEQNDDTVNVVVDHMQADENSEPAVAETAFSAESNVITANPSEKPDACKRTKLFYSVDMVPTFEITASDGKEPAYYVAKPIKHIKDSVHVQGQGDSGGAPDEAAHHALSHRTIAWRQSFSLKEKDRLQRVDADNGCRKQVLRILKVMRNREAGLALLTSYHLKTVLFRRMDALQDADWKSEYLGVRLMDVIKHLGKELESKCMKHYFLENINLLDSIRPKTVDNMKRRFKALYNSEKKMTRVLKNVTT